MRGMRNWTRREKVVVGVIILSLFAFVGSQIGDDGSLTAFLVYLAFTLGISGIAALTAHLFQTRDESSGARPTRLRMTRTQLAILAGVGFWAIYAAVDVSRGDTFVLAAFVAEFVMGLIVVNIVVLATVGLSRLRHSGTG